jgi:hypothetical protein
MSAIENASELKRNLTAKSYVKLSRYMPDDASISLLARGALTWLISRPDGYKIFISQMKRRLGIGQTVWLKIRRELISSGYLKVNERRRDGKFIWEYEVFDIPQKDNLASADECVNDLAVAGNSADGERDNNQDTYLQDTYLQEKEIQKEYIAKQKTKNREPKPQSKDCLTPQKPLLGKKENGYRRGDSLTDGKTHPQTPSHAAAFGFNPYKLGDPAVPLPGWLPLDKWKEFVAYRAERFPDRTLNVRAANSIINDLKKAVELGHESSECLENAIAREWMKPYPPNYAKAAPRTGFGKVATGDEIMNSPQIVNGRFV